MDYLRHHTSLSTAARSGSPTMRSRSSTQETPLEILYSVSVITYQLGMVLHANSEMAGDDRGLVIMKRGNSNSWSFMINALVIKEQQLVIYDQPVGHQRATVGHL